MYLSAKKQRKGEDRRRTSSGFDHQRLGGMCPYALAQLRIARHERNANEIEIDGPVRGTARAFSPIGLTLMSLDSHSIYFDLIGFTLDLL